MTREIKQRLESLQQQSHVGIESGMSLTKENIIVPRFAEQEFLVSTSKNE